ncbi:MAG: hypothetical protein U1E65_19415 [Myxococcota bacterium]
MEVYEHGASVEAYRVVKLAHRSSTSALYAAWQITEPRLRVWLSQWKEVTPPDPTVIAERTRAINALGHPDLEQVLGHFVHQGSVHYATAFRAEGIVLERLLELHPGGVPRAILGYVGYRVFRALAGLQSLNLSHGLISPLTIFLEVTGEIRLRPAPPTEQGPSDLAQLGSLLAHLLLNRLDASPVTEAQLAAARPELPLGARQAIGRLLAHRGEALEPALIRDLAQDLALLAPSHARADLIDRVRMALRNETRPAPPPIAPPPPAIDAAELAPPPGLPPELEPWRESLSLFPPELALSIGKVVRQVARFLGPMKLLIQDDRGEPDGFRGLARRGPFERLLLSEWAIALEIPEEFLRRAAMKEQLYTALAYREQGGSRHQLVLFDAGPLSLGKPRVAHLALLIALLHRARAKNVRFAWGMLQDARRSQVLELAPASVRRLLEARAMTDGTAEDGADWLHSIETPEAADDLWVIGPPGVGAHFAGAVKTVVELEESPQPAQALELKLQMPQSRERSMRLELPLDRDCVQLLRDPFAAQPQSARLKVDLDAAAAMSFVDNGRRLMISLAGGGLCVMHIPTNVGTYPVLYRPREHRLVAATWMRRGIYTLEVDERSKYLLRRLGPRGGLSSVVGLLGGPDGSPERRGLAARPGLCSMAVLKEEEQEFLVLDHDGRLWRILDFASAPTLSLEEVGVTGLSASGYYFVAPRGGAEACLASPWNGRARIPPGVASPDADYRYVSAVGPGPGAVRISRDSWRVLSGDYPTLVAQPGDSVVAVSIEGPPRLVLLDPDRRRICLQSEDRRLVLFFAINPIRFLCADTTRRALAFLDDRGAVTVITMDGRVLSVITSIEPAPLAQGQP